PDGGLYPANGFVGRAAYNRAATCASSRAHVEELAVGEAHTLDQALAGSTENPLGVTRAPCTGAAADIVACPRGVSALALPIARGIAMDSDGSTHPQNPQLKRMGACKQAQVPFNAGGIGHLVSPILTSLVELAYHSQMARHSAHILQVHATPTGRREDPRAIPVESQLSLEHFVSG
ncbi:hypothetical protein DYB31_015589, partial [Aphanomyces astaci]